MARRIPVPELSDRIHRLHKQLLQEENCQQDKDRGDVDTPKVRHETPDSGEYRLGQLIKRIADCRHELIARIDDIEGVKPREHGGEDDNPPIDAERIIECLQDRDRHEVSPENAADVAIECAPGKCSGQEPRPAICRLLDAVPPHPAVSRPDLDRPMALLDMSSCWS